MSEFDLGGKYDVRGVLGRGAMGTVYDAWDPRIDRRVAIKTVRRPGDGDEDAAEALARFRQEARAAGRLVHPHIVGVYDYGETDEFAYIVMEFVEGRSLKARLDEAGTLAPAEALHIMLQVLSGLAYSHGRGVIHRDIKPANIILAVDGEAKIADFGVARLENSDMTSVGTMIGTPSYMAPEQFLGEGVDARSDLYAAGVTLFHMLTGEKPYEGGMTAIMHRVLKTEEPPPRAAERRDGVPPLLDAAVSRAMAKRAADRFQDAAAFSLALKVAVAAPVPAPELDEDATVFGREAPSPDPVAWLKPTTAEPPPVPARAAAVPARRGSRLALPVAAASVLLVAGGGAWFVLGTRAPTPPPVPAAIPAPVQAPVPAPPQAKPPPSAEGAARAVTAALAGQTCVDAVVGPASGGHVPVNVVGAGDTAERAYELAKAASGGVTLDWKADVFAGPYCPVLDLLGRDVTHGRIAVALSGNATVLRDGDDILPQVTAPGFAAYMRVDDFAQDGTVAHFYPRIAGTAPLAPGQVLRLRAADTGQAGPPFGTDVILGIASSVPLPFRRPLVEPASAYLPALHAAIDATRKRGAQVAGGMMVITTRAK